MTKTISNTANTPKGFLFERNILRSIFCCLLLLVGGTGAWAQTININNPGISGTGWNFSNQTLTITGNNGSYTINGTGVTTNRIVVNSGVVADITLNNVNIDVSATDYARAFDMAGATVNLTLTGTNRLKSGNAGNAGLHVPSGAILNIYGTSGSLEAIGGGQSAGIGGDDSEEGGSITIHSGTVTAIGDYRAAGIGGGATKSGGNITINGGTVTAISGDGTTSGFGAGIGGGHTNAGGTITINGGTVTAKGGYAGAGIGGGNNGGNGGIITISGGTVTATGRNGAGIGGGNNGGNGGIITISGGTVMAYSWFGAGIGGGGNATSELSSGNGGIITISGGTVTAININEREDVVGGTGIGGGGGSCIGSGGNGGSITISGGTVKASGDSSHGAEDIGKSSSSSNSGTLTITGGSIHATRGSIGATPGNGISPVSQKVLTLPGAINKAIAAGKINEVNCAETPVPASGVYGIKDVKTDDAGKLYFWLPAASDNSNVELTVNDTIYKGKVGSNETFKLPHAILLDKSGTHPFTGAVYGYGSQSGQALTVTVTNKGYEATGDLTVAVNTAAAFDISTPVSSIAANGTGTFTVTPKTELSVGTYTATVTVSNDDVPAQTFDVSFTVTQRNISNAAIAVTGSRIYTGTQLHPAFTVTDAGETLTTADYTVSAWGANTGAGTNAGSVTLTGQGNYTGSKTQPFTIEKAPLTVTAADMARLAGEPNPAFRLIYTGFVNGEDTAALTARPVAATTAVPSSPAGTYPITVSGGAAANYDFSYVPGTLTVTFLTPSDAGLSFDLTTLPVTVTVPDGVTGLGDITVRYNGRTTVPTEPGTYEVTVDIAAGTGYAGATGIVVGTITIPEPANPPPAQREVILPSLPGITTDPPAGSYTVSSGDDFVFTLTPAATQALLTPVIATGRTTGDNGDEGVEITPNGDGSYTVRIRQVRQPLTVVIDFTTAGNAIDGNRIWSHGGTLHITAAVAGEARIYSVSGGLAKSIPVAAGETVSAPLPAGFYVVVLGGKPYKVFVE